MYKDSPFQRLGRYLPYIAILLIASKFILPMWLIRPSEFLVFPFADWLNIAFNFMSNELGLRQLTRFFAEGVEWLLDVTANLLSGKNRWPRIGPVPWTVIAISAFFVGYALKGWKLGMLSGGTFVWIALAGQWKLAMETLSVILIAAPFSIIVGVLFGVLAWRWTIVEKAINPLLNIAQTLPHFAYMIPVVIFIGVGAKAGAIVTIIFATPPMIRMTLLGLKKVPLEVVESSKMCGATRWQLLRHTWIPTARTEMLIGVNQVIMQCLAMVVLASFIGMPGLGQKLLQLLGGLKIGRSIEIGITIVLIAVMLDRCSKEWIKKQPKHHNANDSWWKRHRLLLIWFVSSILFMLLASQWQIFSEIKRSQAFTISKPMDNLVGQLVVFLDPVTFALRSFLIQWILIPMRDAYLWLPFSAVLLLIAGIGWRIGGNRSALICVAYITLIAMSGWWDRAMITAYTITFAIFLSALIGLPLGILAARNERCATTVLLLCDTLQTFPSFIYLIPVIMLFGVNDVAVVFAVVVFGTVPMLRYTIEGLRGVPLQMLEAADMAGATRYQKLWSVSMPLAFPVIAIGINQAILFSLFMVIIAAFIGTQDLGQEMQRALSSTDVGKGLVLGLCVSFMGLAADHIITQWSHSKKQALGLT